MITVAIAKYGAIAMLVILQVAYQSWAWSIGLALLWFGVWFFVCHWAIAYAEMPFESWGLLASHFPRRGKVSLENAGCIGSGTLDGGEVYFALKADKEALSVRILNLPFVRPKTVTIPWDQIDLGPVGFDEDGNYVASLSVRQLAGCNFVLPWRRKFPSGLDRGEPSG